MASGNESEDELATLIEAKDDWEEVISIGSVDSANSPLLRLRPIPPQYSLANKALTAEEIVSHTKVLKVKIGIGSYHNNVWTINK